MNDLRAYVTHMAASWAAIYPTIANPESVATWIYNDIQRANGEEVDIMPDIEFKATCLEAAREIGPQNHSEKIDGDTLLEWVKDGFNNKFQNLNEMCKLCKEHQEIGVYCSPECPYYASKDILKEITLRDLCNVRVVNLGKGRTREDMSYSHSNAADVMINHFDIISTPDKRIWIYQDGIYKPNGDVLIGQVLDRVAGDMVTTHTRKETLDKIILRTWEDYGVFNPDPCIFGVQNGVLDMRTGEFFHHDPKYKLTRKANVIYDPKAECPEISRFLNSCLNLEDRRSLLEILAAKTTGLVFEYFTAWVGKGQNGKTVCEDLIRAFWGDDRTTEIELSGLSSNRFDLAELFGKDWLINSEVAGGKKESRWIKLISGGGKVTADQKGRDHIEFRANCFIVFDCNNPPKFEDNSHGFKRRLILIAWPYSFVDVPNPENALEKKRDPEILKKITTKTELSGLLNLLIQIAPNIIKTKTIYRRASGERLAEEYDLKSSSGEVFWDRFCDVDEGENTPSAWLYQKYKDFCKLIDAIPLRDREFNDIGRKLYKTKKGRMDTPAGRLQAWRDISFSDDAFNEFLCTIISPSYDSKKEKTITRPAEEDKDQHKTIKKQEQDQQYQQDQQESIGNFEENRDNMGIGKSSFCWSGGPDSDCVGQRDQHCWSEEDFSPDEVLIDMEMHDMAIHESNLEMECNLKDVTEAREHLKRRGWTPIGGGYWKPSSRM